MISAVAVVVPVHDEEATLADCLTAVEASLQHAREARTGLRTSVVVALDACTDASARLLPPGVVRVDLAARTVGLARAVGVERALAGFVGTASDEIWIASTDADSVVPREWVAHHLALADGGADVVVGPVRPPLDDLSPERARAWLGRFVPGLATGHVHGANLGIRADVYRSAGGYAPMVEHEDVDLVAAARAAGARVVATADAPVLTSARLVGRTPGGYARYLREDLGSVTS
ncbi:Glycosyl transferase family 2 [Paraoerskovia marina]|uniref:4,4'-diaponeurosporenoate glycosyltransferase n=1 Tax=Paraoerskovia marina TaxID=545619 RepID=A0A1H1M116_9CELL|nr:glycosyltransferase [Paraoerskovia marina]SDR79719.1 Glycosyl transferase family 2 [Paraoerskovia marina]